MRGLTTLRKALLPYSLMAQDGFFAKKNNTSFSKIQKIVQTNLNIIFYRIYGKNESNKLF